MVVRKVVKKVVRKQTVDKPVVSNHFDNASSDIPQQGKFFLIYAEPGEGKTTLAAQFPAPLFVITHGETGIDSAKRAGVADKSIPVIRLPELYKTGYIPPNVGHEGFITCIDTLSKVADGGHDRRTVVVDTLSGFEKITEQHCASLEFNGDMVSRGQDEWNSWAAGPRRMCDGYWLGEFIPACLRCCEAGYNVVLIAHCKLESIKKPNTADINKYHPDMEKRIFNATSKVAQYVLFLGKEPEWTEDRRTKKKTVAAETRFIGLTPETWYTGKNWDNIQDPVYCGLSAQETYKRLTEVIDIQ